MQAPPPFSKKQTHPQRVLGMWTTRISSSSVSTEEAISTVLAPKWLKLHEIHSPLCPALNLSYSKASRRLCDQQTEPRSLPLSPHSGTCSSPCQQPVLLLVPRRVHHHVAASHHPASEHISTPQTRQCWAPSTPGKRAPVQRRLLVRHQTAPIHSPSPVLRWHMELMLNYCE